MNTTVDYLHVWSAAGNTTSRLTGHGREYTWSYNAFLSSRSLRNSEKHTCQLLLHDKCLNNITEVMSTVSPESKRTLTYVAKVIIIVMMCITKLRWQLVLLYLHKNARWNTWLFRLYVQIFFFFYYTQAPHCASHRSVGLSVTPNQRTWSSLRCLWLKCTSTMVGRGSEKISPSVTSCTRASVWIKQY